MKSNSDCDMFVDSQLVVVDSQLVVVDSQLVGL